MRTGVASAGIAGLAVLTVCAAVAGARHGGGWPAGALESGHVAHEQTAGPVVTLEGALLAIGGALLLGLLAAVLRRPARSG